MTVTWCLLSCLMLVHATKPFVRSRPNGGQSRAELLEKRALVQSELLEFGEDDDDDDDQDSNDFQVASSTKQLAKEQLAGEQKLAHVHVDLEAESTAISSRLAEIEAELGELEENGDSNAMAIELELGEMGENGESDRQRGGRAFCRWLSDKNRNVPGQGVERYQQNSCQGSGEFKKGCEEVRGWFNRLPPSTYFKKDTSSGYQMYSTGLHNAVQNCFLKCNMMGFNDRKRQLLEFGEDFQVASSTKQLAKKQLAGEQSTAHVHADLEAESTALSSRLAEIEAELGELEENGDFNAMAIELEQAPEIEAELGELEENGDSNAMAIELELGEMGENGQSDRQRGCRAFCGWLSDKNRNVRGQGVERYQKNSCQGSGEFKKGCEEVRGWFNRLKPSKYFKKDTSSGYRMYSTGLHNAVQNCFLKCNMMGFNDRKKRR